MQLCLYALIPISRICFRLFVSISVYLSIHLPICLSLCLCFFLSLSVSVSVSLSLSFVPWLCWGWQLLRSEAGVASATTSCKAANQEK